VLVVAGTTLVVAAASVFLLVLVECFVVFDFEELGDGSAARVRLAARPIQIKMDTDVLIILKL
jgi:hypothetical protein